LVNGPSHQYSLIKRRENSAKKNPVLHGITLLGNFSSREHLAVILVKTISIDKLPINKEVSETIMSSWEAVFVDIMLLK